MLKHKKSIVFTKNKRDNYVFQALINPKLFSEFSPFYRGCFQMFYTDDILRIIENKRMHSKVWLDIIFQTYQKMFS